MRLAFSSFLVAWLMTCAWVRVEGRIKEVGHSKVRERGHANLIFVSPSYEMNSLFLEGHRLCPSNVYVCYFRTYFCQLKGPDSFSLSNPSPFNWFDYCIHYPAVKSSFFQFGNFEVTIAFNEEGMRMNFEKFCQMFNPTTTPRPHVALPCPRCPPVTTTTTTTTTTTNKTCPRCPLATPSPQLKEEDKEQNHLTWELIDLRWAAIIGGVATGIIILLLIILILCIRSTIAYKHMKRLSEYQKSRKVHDSSTYKDPYGYPPYV